MATATQGIESRTATEVVTPIMECLLMVGDSAWGAKDWTAATKAYELVLSLDPRNTHALNRMGRLQLIRGEHEGAVTAFGNAYIFGSKDPVTAVNLAVALTNLMNYDEALFWCEEALSLDPGFVAAFVQKAAIFHEQNLVEEAAAVYQKAISIHPENRELKFGLAVLQLAQGNFAEGWPNYDFRGQRLRLVGQLDEYPEWQGEDLTGKTLLVCTEQGLGDQILWSRYFPLLIELGASVVLYSMPELARLFAITFPQIQIVTSDREVAELEPDYWVAMGSLPLRCSKNHGRSLYLKPGQAAIERLAAVVAQTGHLKVGLCWEGSPRQRVEPFRRIPWAEMRKLLAVPDCDFYSLLPGEPHSGLVNLTDYVHDVADTAAAIAHLDLVITSCTMVAHLAGAMGKPVWILVGRPGYWAWGQAGEESQWYGSATVFRSQEPKQWAAVLDQAAERLFSLAAQRTGQGGTVQTCARIEERPLLTSGVCKYGLMTWPVNDRWVGHSLDLYGEFSESELDLMRRVLTPGDTVVEAGAEIGGLSVGLADAVGIKGRVYALEPQGLYFSCLKRNAVQRTILPMHMAAGRDARTITLQAVEERKVHAHGMKSGGAMFEIQQHPIDSLSLDACALIKVDVDGMEHEILQGAERTIDRCRPVLYVEYDKPDLYPEMAEWILAKGYRLYHHMAPLFNPKNFRGNSVNVFGKIVSSMLLCVPMERKDLKFPDLPRIRAEKAQ